MEDKSDKSDIQYKLILLGASSVGKTSLLIRYTDNTYEAATPTVGIDVRYKYITYDNKEIRLDIWDTAGTERFNCIAKSYYNAANGIIFVFDMTKQETLDKLKTLIKEIKKDVSDTEIIIVGNKTDIENEIEVTKENITKFENENNVKIYYTSAKNGDGVEDMFIDLVKKLLNNENIGKVNLNYSEDAESAHRNNSFILDKDKIDNQGNNKKSCNC
jgi:Ras-related protein Rab-18